MSYAQEDTQYTVVINGEEQYSIWPSYKKIPLGWREAGYSGDKNHCLEFIKEAWKDMRPLTLRKKMEERQQLWEEKKNAILQFPGIDDLHPQSETVKYLTNGTHPISCKGIYQTQQNLNKALSEQHLHIVFTDTKGQTCLSLRLDQQPSLNGEKGCVEFLGTLMLDFVQLRCSGTICLESLEGVGKLEIKK